MSSTIEITKAKINSVGYLEVEYKESVELKDGEVIKVEGSKKCLYDPHQDLFNEFDKLKIHLARLCEQELTMTGVNKEGDIEYDLTKFKVTGYVIGGSGEHEGVTLIGRKQLAGGKVLNLIAPFTKWESEHEDAYANAYELEQQIKKCGEEVILYLGGKRAPQVQQELDFGEDN